MEKKDYYSLQSKYSHLEDYREQYRKNLLDFINEAFAMHGNEFVLKPEDCETWEEADEIDQGLNAMDRMPTCLTVYDKHCDTHEVYPTRIYRNEGGYTKYVDGYDYFNCEFTEGWEANSDMESLQAISTFINAVLEQEQNWLKVGSKVKWNDPGINDYDEKCREVVLSRVFTIEKINGEVILISDDEGTEAEVFACELDPVD